MLDQILKGIEKVNHLVKITLGNKRRNVLIDKLDGILITNDGVTIVNNANSQEEMEKIGIELCKIVSNQVNDLVKDGTTQSIILLYEILKRGNELIKEGLEVSLLIDYLENSLEKFLVTIDKYKEEITLNELDKVLITTTSNKTIINNVKKAYLLVEQDGIINMRKTIGDDYLTHTLGYYINSKIKVKDNKGLYRVILYNDVLTNLFNFKDYLDDNILIIVKDTTLDIINYLKKHQVLVIILNHNTNEINEIYEDLEELLNVKCSYQDIYLSDFINIDIKNNIVSFNNLTCDKLINKLKDELKKTKSQAHINRLKERIAKLTKGIVNIYVGGSSEEIIEHKALVYEDAINTAHHALTSGVVKGGGYIYFLLLKELNNIYIDVFEKAFKKVIFQLLMNNNTNIDNTYKDLSFDTWYDYDKKQLININDYQVYDAAKTIKTILKVTIDNACLLFNTNQVLINKQLINKEINDLI